MCTPQLFKPALLTFSTPASMHARHGCRSLARFRKWPHEAAGWRSVECMQPYGVGVHEVNPLLAKAEDGDCALTSTLSYAVRGRLVCLLSRGPNKIMGMICIGCSVHDPHEDRSCTDKT